MSTQPSALFPNARMGAGAHLSRLERAFILSSHRSWWQVRYESGKVINEWQTKQGIKLFFPTVAKAETTRWEELDKRNIRGLYLLCPNGMVGALEAGGDYQFFQLKSGAVSLQGRSLHSHIIGKVDGDDGHCVCYAWEYGAQKLIRFEDNVTNIVYRGIGALNLGHHTGVL